MKKRIFYKLEHKNNIFFSFKSKKIISNDKKTINDYPLIDTLIFYSKKALNKYFIENDKKDFIIKKCIRGMAPKTT